MDKKTDRLRRIRSGDPNALGEWFEENVDAVYAFVYYRAGSNPDMAADITQATFESALERLNDYDPERGDMTTWLRTLSRNIIRDHLREDRRAVKLDAMWQQIDKSLEEILSRLDQDELPDEVLQRKETQELVSVTLANLPRHYKDVLTAKYIEEYSLAAIAEAQATTVDAVKSLLRRARIAFKETFLTLAKAEVS